MKLNFKINNQFSKLKNINLNLIFIMTLFLGMILGSIFIGFLSSEQTQKIESIIVDVKNKNYVFDYNTFFSNFWSYAFFLILIFFSSLSFFGPVIIFLILFVKGFGIGLLSGYIYTSYLLKGILFCIISLFPGIFIASIGFIIFSKESFKFSYKFARKILPNSSQILIWDDFLNYMKKISIITVFFLIFTFVDCFTKNIFYNHFKLL